MVEEWLGRHGGAVAIVIIAAGLVLRARAAAFSYLNPDEAMNFLCADRPTLGEAYRAGMVNPHPPFYYAFLWLWRLVGRSDFLLRLPSVLAGTAAAGFAYIWLRRQFDETVGLVALLLFACTPELVATSAELRTYPFLLLGAMGAICFLESARRSRSVAMVVLSCAWLLLAVGFHYTALLFAAALAAYALALAATRQLGKWQMVAWLAGHAAIAAFAVFLYVTHISKLPGGGESLAGGSWLKGAYYQAGEGAVPRFVLRQTMALLAYLFSARSLAVPALCLALAGMAIAAVRAWPAGTDSTRHWTNALPLLLPVVAGVVAAAWGLSPYGGSRHTVLMAVPLLAAIAVALAALVRSRLWLVLALAALAVPVWNARARMSGGWHIAPANQRRELMRSAVEYVRALTPPGGVVFTSTEASMQLRRYLGECRPRWPSPPGFMEYDCSGIRVEQTRGGWGFNVEKFPQQVRQLAEACGLRRGERIRVFSAGWGTALTTTLLRRYGVSFPGARQFGDNIAVFSVPVGAELLSESLRQADARVRLGLARLARLCERSMPGPVRAAFWPSYYFADSALLLMRHVTSLLLPFSELPRLSGIGFEAQLPALVFYVFGTTEPVPDYISAAAGRANHVSGGCRFRLLAIDPDSVAAVIRVDPAWAAP